MPKVLMVGRNKFELIGDAYVFKASVKKIETGELLKLRAKGKKWTADVHVPGLGRELHVDFEFHTQAEAAKVGLQRLNAITREPRIVAGRALVDETPANDEDE